jgi:hypothetical protein
MDEKEWAASALARTMVRHLRDNHNVARTKAGRRKLRLFQAACFREVWEVLPETVRPLVERLERVAEGGEAPEDLREEAVRLRSETSGWSFAWRCVSALERATVPSLTCWMAALKVSNAFLAIQAMPGTPHAASHPHLVRNRAATGRRHAGLVRELFGDPFRVPSARTFPAEVRGLAQACYDDHAHYPVLADALADLGEEEAAAHCRLPGHVRGCHVVDWVTGRDWR